MRIFYGSTTSAPSRTPSTTEENSETSMLDSSGTSSAPADSPSESRRRRRTQRDANPTDEVLVNGFRGLQVEDDGAVPSRPRSQTPPSMLRWKYSILATNVVLQSLFFALTLWAVFYDYNFRNVDQSFARVGHTTTTSSTILVRGKSDTPVLLQWREQGKAQDWQNQTDPARVYTPATDFTGTVQLTGLPPGTSIEYRLIQNATGVEIIPPKVFKTYSNQVNGANNSTEKLLSFASGSCIKPNSPFFLERGIRGFRILDSLNPDALFFLGDFIYADVPYIYSKSLSTYRWHYKYTFSYPESTSLLGKVPTYFIYDVRTRTEIRDGNSIFIMFSLFLNFNFLHCLAFGLHSSTKQFTNFPNLGYSNYM
jgi:hypothetical protein